MITVELLINPVLEGSKMEDTYLMDISAVEMPSPPNAKKRKAPKDAPGRKVIQISKRRYGVKCRHDK